MTDRKHGLPLTRQAELLDLSRGCLYYEPKAVPEADLALMQIIDPLHLEYPFAGARMLRDMLRARGFGVGRRDVDAYDGHRGAIPQEDHHPTQRRAPDLPLSVAQPRDRTGIEGFVADAGRDR